VALPLNTVLTVAVDDTTAEPQVKAETEAVVVVVVVVVVPSVELLFLQATRMQTVSSKPDPTESINFFMI
jgi:hypothetical protein